MKCQDETVSTLVCMCNYVSLYVNKTQQFRSKGLVDIPTVHRELARLTPRLLGQTARVHLARRLVLVASIDLSSRRTHSLRVLVIRASTPLPVSLTAKLRFRVPFQLSSVQDSGTWSSERQPFPVTTLLHTHSCQTSPVVWLLGPVLRANVLSWNNTSTKGPRAGLIFHARRNLSSVSALLNASQHAVLISTRCAKRDVGDAAATISPSRSNSLSSHRPASRRTSLPRTDRFG